MNAVRERIEPTFREAWNKVDAPLPEVGSDEYEACLTGWLAGDNADIKQPRAFILECLRRDAKRDQRRSVRPPKGQRVYSQPDPGRVNEISTGQLHRAGCMVRPASFHTTEENENAVSSFRQAVDAPRIRNDGGRRGS